MAQTLKERLVRKLSPHLKSRIRARLHQFGLLTPRRAERLILSAVALDGARTFLQIGVNDGQYADPLNLAVHRGYLTGALVEPQPVFFRAMQQTYRGIAGMDYINKAISDQAGTLPFYAFDPADPVIPAWAHGSASLDRAQLMRFADRIPDVDRRIVEIPVELVTVDQLLRETRHANPDILVVDAEGHDARILRQFDLTTFRPKLILYEEESMSPDDASDIRKRFTDAGYELRAMGQDSAAIRGDTQLAKAPAP
ncbi:FkbM family methyltransferase [Sphingomonas sp. 1P06PA]|uniref:FkbM family methyltransferase n=1 Tax=Sphingomonas sp. 1P06PA TaxID=554121 RepID=UPI0039A5C975